MDAVRFPEADPRTRSEPLAAGALRRRALIHPERPLRGSRNQRTYDDLQALFLLRLVRILKLRQQFGGRLSERDARCRLIDTAFRSTMADCEALGLGPEANALLEAD